MLTLIAPSPDQRFNSILLYFDVLGVHKSLTTLSQDCRTFRLAESLQLLGVDQRYCVDTGNSGAPAAAGGRNRNVTFCFLDRFMLLEVRAPKQYAACHSCSSPALGYAAQQTMKN